MIQEIFKIKRDLENNIICEKHNIIASSVCIEKNCKKIINCIKCLSIDKHSHLKNISIFNILNKNIENQIHKKEIIFDQKDIINILKNEMKNFKNLIDEQIKIYQEKLLNKIRNESVQQQIFKIKEEFMINREKFLNNKDDIYLIRKLAEQFFNFSKVDIPSETKKSLKLIEKFKKKLEMFRNNIKLFFSDLDFQKNITLNNEEDKNKILELNLEDYFKKCIKEDKSQILNEILKLNSKNDLKKCNNNKDSNIEKNLKLIQKRSNFFENSNILQCNDIKFIYNDLFDKKLTKTNLLYKGSENNFSSKKFHELCDNKGPTITIIKSEFDKIFGGFIFNSWNSDGNYSYCPASFIFSLNKKEKYYQKPNNKNTFLGSSNFLPIFGYSKSKESFFSAVFNDIKIVNQCNKNYNYSNFGSSFTLPNGLFFNTESCKKHLAGKSFFYIKEIEIYSVELN